MLRHDIDFDAASGLLTRDDKQKLLAGVPRLLFERLAAQAARGDRGGYVQFQELRLILNQDMTTYVTGEADVCTGIKLLRKILTPFDCGIIYREGFGYRLFVAPSSGRADKPKPDVAQRVAAAGVRYSELADAAAEEAHRATQSTERFTARVEELMARASRGFAAAAREFSGSAG